MKDCLQVCARRTVTWASVVLFRASSSSKSRWTLIGARLKAVICSQQRAAWSMQAPSAARLQDCSSRPTHCASQPSPAFDRWADIADVGRCSERTASSAWALVSYVYYGVATSQSSCDLLRFPGRVSCNKPASHKRARVANSWLAITSSFVSGEITTRTWLPLGISYRQYQWTGLRGSAPTCWCRQ